MVQKRPFDEDESIEVSSKQARQLEPNKQLITTLEFPPKSAVLSPHVSGEGDNCSAKVSEKFHVPGADPLFFIKKDVAFTASSSLPYSSWASSVCEEDIKLESPFHLLSSPDYHNTERLPRTSVHNAEIYSFLLDHPPRKVVPVGPDFQANVLEWDGHGNKMTFKCSKNPLEESTLISEAPEAIPFKPSDFEKELAGCCVIPMPESILPADEVGVGRIDCSCEDMGTIRCVRQHILEAREKLKRALGHEAFAELGFCDMGELVAEKWSEDEEQLFHEVVFSNPASAGKNFWDHLAVVFPSRTMKEIVSYYFNVFMLRKRAEQNRVYPMSIDSDDDEWQGTDDSSDNEVEADEDDGFEVESPLDPGRHETFDKVMPPSGVDVCQATAVYPGNVHATCKISRGDHSHETGSPDIKIEPRTSGDGVISLGECEGKSDDHRQWTGTGGAIGHDFMLEACNAREWEGGYVTHPRNEVDLLPTCSMIEEVFGTGSWNCKARDGQGLS
ncbi:hypothetical protein F511_02180 [Dorcoceras hygrometricum]|uniref:Myb-like domain-containing protein n=1 Tax=Dorcoceras hygrometricum TaxID=472368 RepID=A0A2Z7AV18_9LAMI|nr:hypothetical protein F511_02180 [Dorcoceras hygrometricum]